MLGNKKYKELEKRIKALEDSDNEPCEWTSCSTCKCHGYFTDFKKVRKESGYVFRWSEAHYYCLKCAPEYDFVDATDEENIKYFKTVAEHREEVKIKK